MATSNSAIINEDQALSYLNGQFDKVVVGVKPKHRTFFIPKGLLFSRSEFCHTRLNHIKSGQYFWYFGDEDGIWLVEDDPTSFASYAQLLTQNKLDVRQNFTNVESEPANVEEQIESIGQAAVSEYTFLTRLYLFCDKMIDRESKGIVHQAFVEAAARVHDDGARYYPNCHIVNLLYKGLHEGDALRDLLVDFYVHAAKLDLLELKVDDLHQEFISKVMQGLAVERNGN